MYFKFWISLIQTICGWFIPTWYIQFVVNIIKLLIIISLCYLYGFIFTIVFYRFLPMDDKVFQLEMVRDKAHGHYGKLINYQHDRGVCTENFIKNNEIFLQTFNLDLEKRCKTSNYQDLELKQKFYMAILDLKIPNIKQNNYVKEIPVIISYVDQNGDIYTTNTFLNDKFRLNQDIFSRIQNYIFEFIGLYDKIQYTEYEFIFQDKLPNHLLQINAIFVQVEKYDILIEEVNLKFMAYYKGYSYYIYKFPWTSWILIINLMSFSLFLIYGLMGLLQNLGLFTLFRLLFSIIKSLVNFCFPNWFSQSKETSQSQQQISFSTTLDQQPQNEQKEYDMVTQKEFSWSYFSSPDKTISYLTNYVMNILYSTNNQKKLT